MDSQRRRWSRDSQCLAASRSENAARSGTSLKLHAHGYREDVADDDLLKMVIKTHPPTG